MPESSDFLRCIAAEPLRRGEESALPVFKPGRSVMPTDRA
jgi:hypothetical protein